MSRLHLIQEIQTAVKMATERMDQVKLAHYLDDLLTNYIVMPREDEMDIGASNSDYIEMYINSIKVENYSFTTLLNYQYQLRQFAKFVEKPLLKVKTADVRQYLAFNDHLKTSTIVTKMDVISGFYNWLVREEELLKNPCSKISRPKLPKKVREGLTIIELEKVRAACVDKKGNLDLRQRALIEVFYSTGCRLDELRKINRDDIDWHNSSVKVLGKGNKERIVYLSEKAKFYLEMYLATRKGDSCPALFASARIFDGERRRLTCEGIQYQVKDIKKKSGIEKPLHPHILRHTFAQLSLDAGMELADLQALMGHEKADTTLRYAQVSEERKHSAFKRFHAQ